MTSASRQIKPGEVVISVPPLKVVFEEADRAEILRQMDDCLASGFVAAGKYVRAFEEFWADYCRSSHGVACSSGGAALEIIMKALDVKGRDVLVPTNTFIATANAVTFAGGNPVYLDTDPATMGVSLEEIKSRVTENTAAVVVVHIGGLMSPDMPAIADWCREKGIWLVEDAAHAHGSEVDGKRAGQFGIAAAYSFFATKTMTSGEGGMVMTDDAELAETCRGLRDYGKTGQWESVHTAYSSNYRMGEFAAIVGMAQARRLDEFIAYRESIAQRYSDALDSHVQLVKPPGRSSWYKYIVLPPPGVERQALKDSFKELGVSLSGGVYDIPVHLQPIVKETQPRVSLPQAEDLCGRHICLPIFFTMTDEQVDHVISCVQRLI